MFEPYESTQLDALDPAVVSLVPGHEVTPVDTGDVCLNVDTGVVRRQGSCPAERRSSDLAEPAYRGLLVVENPASSSPGLAFLLATVAHFGDAGFRRLSGSSSRDNGVDGGRGLGHGVLLVVHRRRRQRRPARSSSATRRARRPRSTSPRSPSRPSRPRLRWTPHASVRWSSPVCSRGTEARGRSAGSWSTSWSGSRSRTSCRSPTSSTRCARTPRCRSCSSTSLRRFRIPLSLSPEDIADHRDEWIDDVDADRAAMTRLQQRRGRSARDRPAPVAAVLARPVRLALVARAGRVPGRLLRVAGGAPSSPGGCRSVVSATSWRPGLRSVAWFTLWQAAASTAAHPGHRPPPGLRAVPLPVPRSGAGAGPGHRARSCCRRSSSARRSSPCSRPRCDQTVWAILDRPRLLQPGRGDAHASARCGASSTPGSRKPRGTLGASPTQVLRRVTFPLLRPALMAAASITFLFTFTSFGVIRILGGPRHATIEVEIWRLTTQAFALRDRGRTRPLSAPRGDASLMVWWSRAQARQAVTLRLRPMGHDAPPRTRRQRLLAGLHRGRSGDGGPRAPRAAGPRFLHRRGRPWARGLASPGRSGRDRAIQPARGRPARRRRDVAALRGPRHRCWPS